ncbi:MAG: ApaG domain [Chthoniobacterales bacterium]
MQPRLLEGFGATVDRVVHAPDLPASPEQQHPFVYFITIRNESDRAVTVKGRKWVVRADDGHVTAVEGDGVVGCFPRLEPGEQFSYNSYHTTAGRAVAEGSYLAVTEDGEAVMALIPPFDLIPPEGL